MATNTVVDFTAIKEHIDEAVRQHRTPEKPGSIRITHDDFANLIGDDLIAVCVYGLEADPPFYVVKGDSRTLTLSWEK